jgi:hypothetical protein
MSENQNLWKDDGTPRRKHPPCVFCGKDEISSEFDKAQCSGCGWSGSLTELLELEFRIRPGAWLLEFLARRELELGKFALWNGLGADIKQALSNIRRYTHQTSKGPRSIKQPSSEMLIRWSAYLGVDPGSFYRSRTAKE